jgi:hypothetical protein
MRLRDVDDCDEDDSESDSREPIGLPGNRPVCRRAVEVPAVDVVKMLFDAFWIVRDRTTPNTFKTRRLVEVFSTSSVFALFSSVFVSL